MYVSRPRLNIVGQSKSGIWRSFLFLSRLEMSTVEHFQAQVKQMIPTFSHSAYEGSNGCVGSIGGSVEYTGEPYYAAILILKMGWDLASDEDTLLPCLK